jgi:hypothetical protein
MPRATSEYIIRFARAQMNHVGGRGREGDREMDNKDWMWFSTREYYDLDVCVTQLDPDCVWSREIKYTSATSKMQVKRQHTKMQLAAGRTTRFSRLAWYPAN